MLLFSRRFLPFFITQFFGAFTDNLYKNALLVYLTLHLTDSQTLSLYTNRRARQMAGGVHHGGRRPRLCL